MLLTTLPRGRKYFKITNDHTHKINKYNISIEVNMHKRFAVLHLFSYFCDNCHTS
ncbi:hypothetical protein O3G_MSEX002643 [Manduca sexta]|uniref:Uncharacterized protein n=1 Tax=Manduca sexta TaxID=7130 RepID=A0A921YPG6_MANSE|nr:hypothetical protein O3G_MSEX002643 [Manduca sexta]